MDAWAWGYETPLNCNSLGNPVFFRRVDTGYNRRLFYKNKHGAMYFSLN